MFEMKLLTQVLLKPERQACSDRWQNCCLGQPGLHQPWSSLSRHCLLLGTSGLRLLRPANLGVASDVCDVLVLRDVDQLLVHGHSNPVLAAEVVPGGAERTCQRYVVHDVALGNARKFCNGPSAVSDALSSDEFAPQSIYVQFLGITGKLVKF